MSERSKPVPGFIAVNWSGNRQVYLGVKHISAFWTRSDGEISFISTWDDEQPWPVREKVEEIAELIRKANAGDTPSAWPPPDTESDITFVDITDQWVLNDGDVCAQTRIYGLCEAVVFRKPDGSLSGIGRVDGDQILGQLGDLLAVRKTTQQLVESE